MKKSKSQSICFAIVRAKPEATTGEIPGKVGVKASVRGRISSNIRSGEKSPETRPRFLSLHKYSETKRWLGFSGLPLSQNRFTRGRKAGHAMPFSSRSPDSKMTQRRTGIPCIVSEIDVIYPPCLHSPRPLRQRCLRPTPRHPSSRSRRGGSTRRNASNARLILYHQTRKHIIETPARRAVIDHFGEKRGPERSLLESKRQPELGL